MGMLWVGGKLVIGFSVYYCFIIFGEQVECCSLVYIV